MKKGSKEAFQEKKRIFSCHSACHSGGIFCTALRPVRCHSVGNCRYKRFLQNDKAFRKE